MSRPSPRRYPPRDLTDRDRDAIQLLNAPLEAGPPTPAFCKKPAHRSSDWLAAGNRLVCGICHPRAVALAEDGS